MIDKKYAFFGLVILIVTVQLFTSISSKYISTSRAVKIVNDAWGRSFPYACFSLNKPLSGIETSIDEIRNISNKFPANNQITFLLGQAFCLAGLYKDALKEFDKIGIDVKNPIKSIEKGFAFASLNNVPKAVSAWKESSISSNDFLTTAEQFFDRGDHTAAKEYFKYAIWLDSKNIQAYIGLSRSHNMLGQVVKSIQILHGIEAQFPNQALILFELGSVYYQNAEYLKAHKYFKEYTDLIPKSIEGNLALGDTYLKLNEYTQAEIIYLNAVHLSEDFTYNGKTAWEIIWPIYRLGNFYHQINEYEKAKNEYIKAIQLDIDGYLSSWAEWAMGRIFLDDMDIPTAREFFSQAITHTNNTYLLSQIHLGLAQTYLAEEKPHIAIDYLKQAMDYDQQNEGLLRFYADELIKLGQYQDAKLVFRLYLELWPDNQEIKERLERLEKTSD